MREADSVDIPFRRHGVRSLLLRLGSCLPLLLTADELILASCNIERQCWRELGYKKHPIFDGDLPDFLKVDGDGYPVASSIPLAPAILAATVRGLKPRPPQVGSCVATNFDSLARVLNLTLFEFQWLLWSYCVRGIGRAILPVIPIRSKSHGCEVLALLSKMRLSGVRNALASRRLYTWGFLDGGNADCAMPSTLSGWLLATDQFVKWIEQPYDSDIDELIALCQAQVSC